MAAVEAAASCPSSPFLSVFIPPQIWGIWKGTLKSGVLKKGRMERVFVKREKEEGRKRHLGKDTG